MKKLFYIYGIYGLFLFFPVILTAQNKKTDTLENGKLLEKRVKILEEDISNLQATMSDLQTGAEGSGSPDSVEFINASWFEGGEGFSGKYEVVDFLTLKQENVSKAFAHPKVTRKEYQTFIIGSFNNLIRLNDLGIEPIDDKNLSGILAYCKDTLLGWETGELAWLALRSDGEAVPIYGPGQKVRCLTFLGHPIFNLATGMPRHFPIQTPFYFTDRKSQKAEDKDKDGKKDKSWRDRYDYYESPPGRYYSGYGYNYPYSYGYYPYSYGYYYYPTYGGYVYRRCQ